MVALVCSVIFNEMRNDVGRDGIFDFCVELHLLDNGKNADLLCTSTAFLKTGIRQNVWE